MILRGLRFSSLSSFLQKNGRYQLDYGSSLPNQQSFKVSDTVRYKLMLLLDVELLCGSDWRDFAKSLKASNEDIRFLENRKYYHESPTQHIINVFEMMKMPLISLRDIFIDLERDDIAQILTLEIGSWLPDARCRFTYASRLPTRGKRSRNCDVQFYDTIVHVITIIKPPEGSGRMYPS